MRVPLLAVLLWVSCALPVTAKPALRLVDEGLPLWELRPLDRHVWVLTLDGTWTEKPEVGVVYHVRVQFPDGQSYSHRVLDPELLEDGEVRCVLQEYQLARHGVAKGGTFTVAVTRRRTLSSPPEVISNELEVRWPLKRPIVSRAPLSRRSPPRPIDDLPLPGEPPPVPLPPIVPPPGKEKSKPKEEKPRDEKPKGKPGEQGPVIE